MRLWRLCETRFSTSPLDGTGAALAGGRWNPKGLPLVYTSTTSSLALLEVLVHIPKRIPLANTYSLIELDVPDVLILPVDTSKIDANWNDSVAPISLATIGAAWIQSLSSVGLLVPSAVCPGAHRDVALNTENNVLLNPAHSDISKVIVIRTSACPINDRLHS